MSIANIFFDTNLFVQISSSPIFSTTSNEDFVKQNTDLLRFSRHLPNISEVESLKYPYKWYLGSQSECSCTCRHLYSSELEFSEPVDWYEEESEDINATLKVIGIICIVVSCGYNLDCIDVWYHQEIYPVVKNELEVNLSTLKDEEFRLFKSYHSTYRHLILYSLRSFPNSCLGR